MHWLRGLVRGYVVHEMTGSFVKPVDLDHVGISIFLRGLSVLREECDNSVPAPALSPAEESCSSAGVDARIAMHCVCDLECREVSNPE